MPAEAARKLLPERESRNIHVACKDNLLHLRENVGVGPKRLEPLIVCLERRLFRRTILERDGALDLALEQRHTIQFTFAECYFFRTLRNSVDVKQRWQSVLILRKRLFRRASPVFSVDQFAVEKIWQHDRVTLGLRTGEPLRRGVDAKRLDRKSTRLNSRH